jgi:hypothetical protein
MAAAALALPLGLIALPATTASATTTPHKVLFGLIDHWDGWSSTTGGCTAKAGDVCTDETQLQWSSSMHSGIVGTFVSWSSSNVSIYTRAGGFLDRVRGHGGVTEIDLTPATKNTLNQIRLGSDDAAFRAWAQGLKAWGHPVLLRLFPEMNGNWEPYSPTPSNNQMTAWDFTHAWQHVYNLFRGTGGVGATNVEFVWNPNRYLNYEKYSFAQLWPGAGYVQWLALDLYNQANASAGTLYAYQLAAQSVSMMRALSGAATKPLMAAELGCNQYSNKPTWIKDSIVSSEGLQRLGVEIVAYWDEYSGGSINNRFDSSSASLTAARDAYRWTASLAGQVVYPGHGSTISLVDQLVSSTSTSGDPF